MATQKCPKCRSNRIRLGYHRTGFFSKLIFRYNLLCNNCNLQFVGFAIPGTISNKNKVKKVPDPNLNKPLENNIALKLSDIPVKKELVGDEDKVKISQKEVKAWTNLIENFVVAQPKKARKRKNSNDKVESDKGDIQIDSESETETQTKKKVRKRVRVRF